MVQHFVLKRGHHHGELQSVFDTAGVVLSGVAAVGGCVATAGIPCVIAGVAGGLGAINSTNHLYGDVQQAWTGQPHSTALSSLARKLGASSSNAARYQRYADMAAAVSSVFDLGVGALSLVKFTRVGDGLGSGVTAEHPVWDLDVPSSNSPTINLNSVDTQIGKALASVEHGDSAESIVNGAKLNRQLTLDEITNHSFEKHVLKQGEFSGLGIRTIDQFREHVKDVLSNPSSIRYYKDGRTAYIQESTGTVLVRNPNGSGQSTMFQPKDFNQYINLKLSKNTTPQFKDNEVSLTGQRKK